MLSGFSGSIAGLLRVSDYVGEQSLRLELDRRRAVSEAVRDTVAPPPGPMSLPVLPIAGGVVLVGLWLLRPRKKKPSTPKEQLVTLAAVTAATIKAQRKDAKKTARKAEKEVRRRGSRAYNRLEAMEHAAKITHAARVLGPVAPLPPHEVDKLQNLAKQLGIPRAPDPCTLCNACPNGSGGPVTNPGDDAIVDVVVRKLRGQA